MKGFEQIIEERIRSAALRGDFDHLPGAGKPLELDDELLVPADVRAANRILKNSGYVPTELLDLREFARLAAHAAEARSGNERTAALRRLQHLLITLDNRGLSLSARGILARYRDPLLKRLAAG